jgi:EmrB/QacA subfamily drug resistance transporter
MAQQIQTFSPRERWLATWSLLLGMVAFTTAIMVANVILPQLMTSLRADLDQVQWVLTGSGIAQTVTMPMVGWLTSLVGHRALYLGSLALFCAGSVLSGLAWSIESLIAFQVLSGLGVGLMQPMIMVIMYQLFPPSQRGLALGLSMVGWSVGPAIGPIVGGYLVEMFNWRAAFYAAIPLGVGGLICAFLFLPTLPKPTRKVMDQFGLLTMTMALVTILMALTQGRREGWDSSYILTLFAISGVSTVGFLVWEWCSTSPLVDLRLFRYVPFTMGCLVVFISTTVFRGTGVLSIVFVQQVFDFTPLQVGWLLLAGNIAYGIAVVVSGKLADRINTTLLTIVGLGIFVVAFYWFAGVNETVSAWVLTLLLAMRLTAFGVMGSPNNLSTMRAVPEEHVVMASGIFSLMRTISGTVGSAVSVTIYDQRYFYHVQRYAEENDLNALGLQETLTTVEHFLTWAGDLSVTLAVRTSAAVQQRLLAEATTAAYQDYFLLAAAIGALAMLPALPWQEWWQGLRRLLWGQRPAKPAITPALPATATVSSSQGTGNGADAEPVHGSNEARRSVRR